MSRLLGANRRTFLTSSVAAGTLGPGFLSSLLPAGTPRSPNDRLMLGFIGVGTMGRGHVSSFLKIPEVQIVAICDVVEERREHCRKMVEEHYAQAKGKGGAKSCQTCHDFRAVLERKDIDGVVIATPDHWHTIPCVLAAQAGKHIYCEKPLTHRIAEGRKLIQAVRNNNIVFQTGSQQRSEYANRFRFAVELVRNGRIGKVKVVRIGVGAPAVPCDLPDQPVPGGTDWNLWLGPAPFRGYNEVLCPKGIHKHFPAWRDYREYAGGRLADMGAHHFDIAQWALGKDNSGPVRIEPPHRKETKGLRFVYANGIEMIHGGPADCTFEGEDGTIRVSRGKLESTPEDIVKQPLTSSDLRVYPSSDHRKNWLDCIRTRQDPICTAEIGHHSATICHLANIGYQLRRPLRWDPAVEHFLGDEEANQLAQYSYRPPWRL